MVQRIDYLGRLAKWREKQAVKVISGMRGCGKTTLLALYIDWLKRSGIDDRHILFINMETPENTSLLHFQGLYNYVKKHICTDAITYIFFDEIQRCENYKSAINGLLKHQVDLYIALSTAPDLSRIPHIEIKMLPLSFAEYLAFSRVRAKNPQAIVKGSEVKTFPANMPPQTQKAYATDRRIPRQKAQMEKFLQREAFNHYISFGGFPFAAALGDDAGLLRQCVEGIYHTALIKDVAGQAGINSIPLLEHIAQKMSHYTGRPLSSKKISAAMGAGGRGISTNTVETYMRALTAALVFYHAGRFDIKTGKRLKTLGKYYVADLGIRNLLLETASLTETATPTETASPAESASLTETGISSQLENIVYMELLRRGGKVYTGKYGSDEINFVAFVSGSGVGVSYGVGASSGDRVYYQVMATVRDAAILARKLSPLERIRDNHPKYILSLDETPFRSTRNGIIQMNLIDWLVEKQN